MSGFIFDMDGTLLDSIKIWHEAEQQVMSSAGIQLAKSERDELNALTLEEAGDFFHDRFGLMESGEAVVKSIVDYMLRFYRTSVEVNPGAVDFVQAVFSAGEPMCVLSSSPQSFLKAGLGRTGMDRFFKPSMVISAEDMGMIKRDPKTFDYVCAQLGTDPADTWLFDDSWYALKTAHEFGLRTVGVFSTDGCGTHEELNRYCDIVVDDFTELDVNEFLN